MTGAYLFAGIDTATGMVTRVLILSEERPSVIGDQVAWGLLWTTQGHDFADAQAKMLQQLQLPWLRWCNRFRVTPAPAAPVVRGRRP